MFKEIAWIFSFPIPGFVDPIICQLSASLWSSSWFKRHLLSPMFAHTANY